MTSITIPLPLDLQCHIQNIENENFCLWMFISQNDLWQEAQDFLSDARKCGQVKDYREDLPF